MSKFDFIEVAPGRVLVKFPEVEEKTSGGIFIPEQIRRNKSEADVVAVGGTSYDGIAPFVAVGDTAIVLPYQGDRWLDDDGEEYWIYTFRQLMGKRKKQAEIAEPDAED